MVSEDVHYILSEHNNSVFFNLIPQVYNPICGQRAFKACMASEI